MNSRTAGLGKLLCILWVFPLLPCEAGSVRLLNGESHGGKLALSGSGLAVTEAGSTATFDLANILVADFGENAASEAALLPAGVILNNGSFVVGTVKSLDEPTIQVGPPSQSVTLQRPSVAAVVFAPIPRTTIYRIPNGKTGAVLSNGDFFEGAFTGIKDNFATIDSPLFGPQRFAIGSRVAAVVLHDIQPGMPRYELTAKNGSRFFSNDLRVDRDGILLNDPILGQVKVGEGDLVEIRAGSGRYQLLTDLKPVAAVSASGADAMASVSTHGEGDAPRVLFTGSNVAVSYAVPPGFNTFTCRIALPQDSSPRARMIFSVFCDGRIVFRSSPIIPGPNPPNLRANLGTAQRMTIRAEPAMPGSDAASGTWIDPMFLRQ